MMMGLRDLLIHDSRSGETNSINYCIFYNALGEFLMAKSNPNELSSA